MRRAAPSVYARSTFRAAVGAVVLAASTAPGATEPNADESSPTNDAARFDYLLHCSGCHRTDGTGSAPDVPTLRETVGALVASPEGREYIARVPEVAQSPLDDDDLARLLNWMLREFNAETLPAGFRPLDGAEVGAARSRILTDPLRARVEIVGAYAPGKSGPRDPAPAGKGGFER